MKTSKTNFETFKKEFKKWQKFLSIENYEIVFEHVDLGHSDAEIEPNYEGRVIQVRLTMNSTREDIKLLACHEAIELFLHEARALAGARFGVNNDDMDHAFHGVVQGLLDIFYFKNRKIPK